MISEKDNIQLSKFLSLVLRHKPETIGIQLDENGWVDVSVLLNAVNNSGVFISKEMLHHIVETNTKKRFAFNDDQTRIRASQGHSIEIELGYKPSTPPALLYHGTAEGALNSILETGLQKRNRHHVHLSMEIATALKVGERHGKPVILQVDAQQMHNEGYAFYKSENDVWLVDEVPVQYLKVK